MSKKFLIGQLACYGDCLYATTIAKQIKVDYPDSHITWAIGSRYKSVLELNPHVDKIWEIEITDGDYYNKGWKRFESESESRKANGEFDEIIYSQIYPKNAFEFYRTIRETTLNAYKNPINVSVSPVIKLSVVEINNVKIFSEKYNLDHYKHVVLFECNPGSNQSIVNPEFAISVCRVVTSNKKDVCFILTTPQKIITNNPQIIDASELSFRENAELTKYCTLLIGCSSGITWLSTSDWAKKLPMLQLLDSNYQIFAGVHFDFETYSIDNSSILELVDFDIDKVCVVVKELLFDNFFQVSSRHHQVYKPNIENLYFQLNHLIHYKYSLSKLFQFYSQFIRYNKNHNNVIKYDPLNLYLWLTRKYWHFWAGVFYRNFKSIVKSLINKRKKSFIFRW